MGQIQRAPARPHLPRIYHHLQRKSLQFVCEEFHAPWKRNLGPNLIRLASLATQWPNYDSLDVQCHHQGPSQLQDLLGMMQLDNLAKVLRTHRLRWIGAKYVGWLVEVQKLNLAGDRCGGRPKKTWTEVIDMDRLALGLTETHTSNRNAWNGRFRSAIRLGPPLY